MYRYKHLKHNYRILILYLRNTRNLVLPIFYNLKLRSDLICPKTDFDSTCLHIESNIFVYLISKVKQHG